MCGDQGDSVEEKGLDLSAEGGGGIRKARMEGRTPSTSEVYKPRCRGRKAPKILGPPLGPMKGWVQQARQAVKGGKKGQKGEVTGRENSLVVVGVSWHQQECHRRQTGCCFRTVQAMWQRPARHQPTRFPRCVLAFPSLHCSAGGHATDFRNVGRSDSHGPQCPPA